MYQKMYSTLFNAITDALEQLERKNISSAEDILKAAQCAAGIWSKQRIKKALRRSFAPAGAK